MFLTEEKFSSFFITVLISIDDYFIWVYQIGFSSKRFDFLPELIDET